MSNPNIRGRSVEFRVDQVTIDSLIGLTDVVLLSHGLPDQTDSENPIPLVEFKTAQDKKFGPGYDLKIYSLAEGATGFNTPTTQTEGYDNSRRWVVYIDRGTTFGAAYDNQGTVYADGRFEPSKLVSNIDTGPIDNLIWGFFHHGIDTTFELFPEYGKEAA